MTDEREQFAEWCIIELMGHRRLAGRVTEQEIAGAAFLRLDIPGADGTTVITQFYAPASVYCLTPTTEELACAVAVTNTPQPVQQWELPAPATRPGAADEKSDEDKGDVPWDDESDDAYRAVPPRGQSLARGARHWNPRAG